MTNKIGIINYFATGEGSTLAIYINYTEDEIKKDIGEYFSICLQFYDAQDIIDAEESDKEYVRQDEPMFIKSIMESHTPILFKSLKRKMYIKSSYKHHFNLG